MFSLIMGAVDGVVPADRMLEGLPPQLESVFKPGGVMDTRGLAELPVLLMPEIGDTDHEQMARVGLVLGVRQAGREFMYQFVQNPYLPPIPSERIEALAGRLGLTNWDFHRTRWTVRDADLYRALLESSALDISAPTVFRIPAGPPDPGRVAAMMPFGAEFIQVWETIKGAVADGGWRCQRADDIWEHSAIIDDVASLIARSKVVVCDLTGRNANVFYEAGIAHTLGREVILITQSSDDVPFDLRHHRYIRYLNNVEGLTKLQADLSGRLQTLMARLPALLT